jgi:hypothetical protein
VFRQVQIEEDDAWLWLMKARPVMRAHFGRHSHGCTLFDSLTERFVLALSGVFAIHYAD